MLGFLFRRLTADPAQGSPLFDALTRIAREPHWYVEGAVPDTLDGRFAVLATVTALTMVRLERAGPDGDAASVTLTERFIEVMESEHRELGIGDPALGRTVRKLVAMLAKRTELWRSADEGEWTTTTQESLYKDNAAPEALRHSAAALKDLAAKLEQAPLAALARGNIG